MIKDVRIVGHREFQSKSGKDLCIVSWCEPYSESEGKGAAAYSAFVSQSQSAEFLDSLGKTVRAFTSHRNGFHTIELIK